MRTQLLVATPVDGPLSADQLTAIAANYRSIHQFQPFDQFSVVFISEQLVLQLDRGAMESIVDHLAGLIPNCRGIALLTSLTNRLRVKPQPEPEVVKAAEPEPKPDAVPQPETYSARFKLKFRDGYHQEVRTEVLDKFDLSQFIQGLPDLDLIQSIKIKLDPQ